jgi:hypothetical protein
MTGSADAASAGVGLHCHHRERSLHFGKSIAHMRLNGKCLNSRPEVAIAA